MSFDPAVIFGAALTERLIASDLALQPPPTPPPVTPPPSSWPDASNTGYRNAPGFTGKLASGAGVTVQSGKTYVGLDFPGGLSVGSRDNPVTGVTDYKAA